MKGLAVLLVLSSSPALGKQTGLARVIDGDTLEISGVIHRLHGIDAPERAQMCGAGWACGKAATQALRTRINAQPVTCSGHKRDRYKRQISVCRVGGMNLNAWLVSQGWAMAYRRYSSDYIPLEAQAKAAERGVWKGRFIAPWRWRKGVR